MTNSKNIEQYFKVILSERLYSNRRNLEFHLKTLFDKINFLNKNVLDVGGGNGLYSFYAAYKGAKEVVCLEPELEGSDSGANATFIKLSKLLDLNNVKLEVSTLQDYKSDGKAYDIVFLLNSINHLDEAACINLQNNGHSYEIYKNICIKIWALSNPNAKIIITDCSNSNFYAMLGINNPFNQTIEWNKHQSPNTWINMLKEVGFINPELRWSSFNTLGPLGHLFLGNRFISYFLISHFYIRMEKPLKS